MFLYRISSTPQSRMIIFLSSIYHRQTGTLIRWSNAATSTHKILCLPMGRLQQLFTHSHCFRNCTQHWKSATSLLVRANILIH
mgnify:CR=1 FL=1